jgi:hypothetical protein
LPAHDQASVHRMLHLGAAKVRSMRAAVGTSVHSEPQALPHWAGSFNVTTGANRTATRQSYSCGRAFFGVGGHGDEARVAVQRLEVGVTFHCERVG